MKKLLKGKICLQGHPYDTGPCSDYPPNHPSLKYHIEDENKNSYRLEDALELYHESSTWIYTNNFDFSTRLEVSKLFNKFRPGLSSLKIKKWICNLYEKYPYRKATLIIRKWFPGFYPSLENLP